MSANLDRSKTRDATINLRLQASARDLIDQAAATLGKSRTEFMVEAARREAENVLLDHCFFALSARTFADFAAMLEQSPTKNPRLQRLLRTAAPWE